MTTPEKTIDDTLTSNTSTDEVSWDVGRGVFTAYGTFGGGTAALEMSTDDGDTFVELSSDLSIGNNAISLSDNGAKGFFVPTDSMVRVTLSGATDPNLEVEAMEMTESSKAI